MTAAATVVLAKALKRKIQVNPMAKPQEKSLYLCSQSFSRAASPFCAGKDKEEKAPQKRAAKGNDAFGKWNMAHNESNRSKDKHGEDDG